MELLPKALETVGKIFPASWGYRLLSETGFRLETLLPLLSIFLIAALACAVLLHKVKV